MKKRVIAGMAFAAYLALCAAVWPQNEPTEETPTPPTPPAVAATQLEVPETPEIEESIIPEKEKPDAMQPEPEPSPIQTHPSSEVQNPTEQNATLPQEPEPVPVSPDSTSDNMVYVPGFGWLESQGPNHCEYAADMYENGSKFGIMG